MSIEAEVKTADTGTGLNEIADVVFDLDGVQVPNSYPYLLWGELVRCLPWLAEEGMVGVHPLRGSASGENTLLSKRTKLILRVPAKRVKQASALTGQILKISGDVLTVGKFRLRALQAATTLHAHIVESNLNEVEFIAEMKQQLQEMKISCNLICDKFREITDGSQTIKGYGLVLHDLKLPASVEIQGVGLGGMRHFGCGIFVPFKAISGLD